MQPGVEKKIAYRWIELFLPAVLLILSLLWLLLSVPLSAPDEAAHVLVPREIIQEQHLPVLTRTSDSWENHQPPLYYLLSVPFVWVSQKLTFYHQIQFDRLLSFALFLSAIVAVLRISRLLWPSNMLARIAMLSFLGIPMVLYSSGSYNNDILALAVSSWLLFIVVSKRKTLRLRDALLLGACIGAGVLTKVNMYPLLAVAGLWVLWRQSWRSWLTVSAVVLLVCGWWFVHNRIQVGDLLGVKYAKVFFLDQHQDIRSWRVFVTLIVKGAASFLGVFEKMNVWLPKLWYAITYACLAYFGYIAIRHRRIPLPWFVGISTVAMVAAFVVLNSMIFQPQGRYLIALIPLFGMVVGAAITAVPKYGAWVMGVWCLLLMIGNVYGIFALHEHNRQHPVAVWQYPYAVDVAAEIHNIRPLALVQDGPRYTAHAPIQYFFGGRLLQTSRPILLDLQTAETQPMNVRVEWRIAGQRWFTKDRSYTAVVTGSARLPIPETSSTALVNIRLSFLDIDRVIQVTSLTLRSE